MKTRHILCFCLLSICLLLAATTAMAASFGMVYNTESLNLRSQGSSRSTWLGAYPRGTWVEIDGSQNNFYHVRTSDGKTGYMSKNYINASAGDPIYANIALVTNQNGGAFLNFRAQPSYNAEVLDIFYYGVPLYCISQQNGWYYVCINGQYGYVRSEYVTYTAGTVGSSTVATIKTPNNTAMNLRSGPGLSYPAIRQFAGDRYVMVLAKGNDWWQVAIDGYTGFMSTDFLVEGLWSAKDIAADQGGTTAQSYAIVANPRSTQYLNLRAQASTGASVLMQLYNGTKLWVDEQGTEWCKVTTDTGVTGYVMTRYLTLHNLPSTPTRTVSHPNGSFVNLRSAPDMITGGVITRVSSGQKVTIITPGATWCRVNCNGTIGYMMTYFLK